MPDLFIPAVSGAIASSSDYNANLDLVEASLQDIGPFIISGLTVSAGAGLDVSVASGTASIGGRVVASGSFSIMGLTPSTVNHLYMLRNGTGTSNTTGTQPANSVKLGTATTDGSGVTAVGSGWASGRQTKRRTEDLVHGAGAGHPRAVDLASHHASNNEGNEVKGVLPAAALPMAALKWAVRTVSSGPVTVLDTDVVILVNAASGAIAVNFPTAVGRSGQFFVVKKIDASANGVTLDANSTETIDGALTAVIVDAQASIMVISDNANWHII